MLRCLEPEPERRFRTAQEVLRAVEGTSQQPRPETVPGLTDPLISGLYTRASESLLTYDPWECRRAIALFEQLTTLEPGFAPGWARLAAACVYMGPAFPGRLRAFRSSGLSNPCPSALSGILRFAATKGRPPWPRRLSATKA